MRVHSFAPASAPNARRLILGSMPGKASLAAGEYYAHPRNAFWKIMEQICGVDAGATYAERLRQMSANRVALWDVMKTCTRESSLDSDIVEDSIVPNAFEDFFDAHPEISHVYFNGAKAEKSFVKYVLPELGDRAQLQYTRLPSTSPAHASLSLSQKTASWRQVGK